MVKPPSDHVGDVAQVLRVGSVLSVDLAAGTCTLEIGDPDEQPVATTKIAWGVIRAGETVVWSPPSVGEQVLLFCPDGDIAQAIPFGALYCNAFPAPGGTLREFVRFGDGAEIGYDPEAHHYDITLPGGATMAIVATGGVTVEGDVAITGNVAIDGNTTTTGTIFADGNVTGDGVSLKTHRHTGVQTGGGISGAPQ